MSDRASAQVCGKHSYCCEGWNLKHCCTLCRLWEKWHAKRNREALLLAHSLSVHTPDQVVRVQLLRAMLEWLAHLGNHARHDVVHEGRLQDVRAQ